MSINDLFDGDLCKNLFYFHSFSFSFFERDIIRCVNFTYIVASNTASDDLT